MRVSLCVICGNERQHILTMLRSFAPVFDELSLVRAIGAKEADETVLLARSFCEEYDKGFVFSEYKNGQGAENWEHVDSFANARNVAFAQGTGDWLIWADCDDVIENAEDFRAKLETLSSEVKMVRCLYDVRGSGKKLFRERAIRRESFVAGRKWHHDVHENLLLLEGDKHEDWQAPIWVHVPVEVKRDNRRRNLRILSHSVREAATQYFYIHQEHYCSQSRDAAFEYGKIALAFPNLPPAFRYETLLNCARLSNSHREAHGWLMDAHGIFPWCREALAALILLSFEKKDYKRAIWWADKMLGLREPLAEDRPWTHEPKYYGWAGYDLAARAYRVGGNPAMAGVLQWQFHEGAMPKISLLHATRGRSSQAVHARDLWLNAAAKPSQIEHIFAVDADDKVSGEMAKQFTSVVSEEKSCVAAWNLAAKSARGDILVQMSDDWTPPLNWDTKLLEAAQGKDPQRDAFVIAVGDGTRRDDLLCMAILSRARYEAQGNEVFHSGYPSVFSDNEFSYRAFRDGCVIDKRSELVFEHHHPAFGKGKMDATYQHSNSTERFKAGEALFRARNPNAK